MVDKRIIPDLRWIAQRYPIYITDGYSGPLPNGEHVGCHNCHVKGSDHYNGLAVDIVPAEPSSRCDATGPRSPRLALWAEPRQNEPLLPFRWVGYNGDAGHGCGNHLHLSWNHAPAPGSSSPNGSKSSRSAPAKAKRSRAASAPRRSAAEEGAAEAERPDGRHLQSQHRRPLPPRHRRLSPSPGRV